MATGKKKLILCPDVVLKLMPECRKWYFQGSKFQNFLGEYAPRFPLGEGPYSCLLEYGLPPTLEVAETLVAR